MLTLSEIADRFSRVKWSGREKFQASCTGHEDKDPSLSVGHGNNGGFVFRCFAGCEVESILRGAGLTWQDVMPERERGGETTWIIRNAQGDTVAEHVRVDDGGKKRFFWRRDGRSGLHGLPAESLPLYRSELVGDSKRVVVCEGEKAADAAAALGVVAVGTVCGASATPSAEALKVLAGRTVTLWPDNDPPGMEHMTRIASALEGVAAQVRWISIPGAKPKADAADYRGTLEELRGYVTDEPTGKDSGPLVMFGDRVREALEELDRLQSGDYSAYVSTGIPSLDLAFGGGGIRRGEVTLVGAPTGSGKTTLVVQMAMAAQEKGLAIIVSPEMSATDLVIREIVRRSGVPKWKRAPWASTAFRDSACKAHISAFTELQQKPPKVAIYDAPLDALDDAIQTIRDKAKAQPVSLVAFDYAQQLADEDGKTPRYLQVGKVAYRSIELARELGCAVVVTSQVNTVKDGKSKDYTMRESAVLEQKAANSLVFAVERDELGKVVSAEFIAKKVRDGAMFRLPVNYDPGTFSIRDMEKPRAEVVGITDYTVKDWKAEEWKAGV